MQIGQGESLVQFFVSGFAKSPASNCISGEQRAGCFIANALFAEVDNFKKNGKEDMNDKIRRRIKVGCEG